MKNAIFQSSSSNSRLENKLLQIPAGTFSILVLVFFNFLSINPQQLGSRCFARYRRIQKCIQERKEKENWNQRFFRLSRRIFLFYCLILNIPAQNSRLLGSIYRKYNLYYNDDMNYWYNYIIIMTFFLLRPKKKIYIIIMIFNPFFFSEFIWIVQFITSGRLYSLVHY